MNISDIRPTNKKLVLAKPSDVDALGARLWVTFPTGYLDYVTRLGEGMLGSFVRIYPPWRIEKELAEWRRRINKYWFWDEGADVLPKERALECVIVGDTENGDELVFHPTRPNRLFVLPRDSEKAFVAGADLLAAVEWMCGSGELGEKVAERDFKPFDSRNTDAEAEERGAADAEGESLDDIIESAKRWAERHRPRRSAQKAAKEQLKKGQQAKLLYEAVFVEGEYAYGSGYTVAYEITEKARGEVVGIFRWHGDGDSEASTFEPMK